MIDSRRKGPMVRRSTLRRSLLLLLAAGLIPIAAAVAGQENPEPTPPPEEVEPAEAAEQPAETEEEAEEPAAEEQPPATEEPEEVEEPEAVKPPPKLHPRSGTVFIAEPTKRTYRGEPITLSLKNADLVEVLRSFAKMADVNMIIDSKVQGSVTVELKRVPWDQALEAILKINNLGMEVDGNIWTVKNQHDLPGDG
jgi:type IV pilus assembly protein PilQ